MEEMENEGVDDVDMPFDVARMAYGGFKAIVEYQAETKDGEPIGTTG